jgi:hypothetical protein
MISSRVSSIAQARLLIAVILQTLARPGDGAQSSVFSSFAPLSQDRNWSCRSERIQQLASTIRVFCEIFGAHH